MTSVSRPRSRLRAPRRSSRVTAAQAGRAVPRESWDLGLALTVAGTDPAEPLYADEPAPRRPTDP